MNNGIVSGKITKISVIKLNNTNPAAYKTRICVASPKTDKEGTDYIDVESKVSTDKLYTNFQNGDFVEVKYTVWPYIITRNGEKMKIQTLVITDIKKGNE